MNKTWWAALALGTVAISAAKPQGHNLMKLPSFRNVVEVRSSIPGRMRLYIPAVAANMAQATEMKAQLEATGAVHGVEIVPRTSTVLVRYDETQVEGAVVEGAVIKLMGLDEAINRAPVSSLTTGVKTLYDAVNRGLWDATDGLVTVKSLTGTALTVAAVKNIAANGLSLPGAATMLWWAARLFGGEKA
jgi:copper chaperone CopZ